MLDMPWVHPRCMSKQRSGARQAQVAQLSPQSSVHLLSIQAARTAAQVVQHRRRPLPRSALLRRSRALSGRRTGVNLPASSGPATLSAAAVLAKSFTKTHTEVGRAPATSLSGARAPFARLQVSGRRAVSADTHRVVRTSSCPQRPTCRAGAERGRSSTGVQEVALPGRQPASARSGWPAGRAPAAPARLSAARVSRWRLRAGPLCAAETRAAAAQRRSKAGAPAHAQTTC